MKDIVAQLREGKMIQWEQIWIRLVTEDDAKAIFDIRNLKASGYINTTNGTIEDQRKWIQDYKIREENGTELYLISTNEQNSECWALIRLILIEDYFVIGSWVSAVGAPLNTAIYLELFTKTLGFELVGDTKCQFEVRKKNTQVIKYHKMLGAVQVGEKLNEYIYEVKKDDFLFRRDKVLMSLSK